MLRTRSLASSTWYVVSAVVLYLFVAVSLVYPMILHVASTVKSESWLFLAFGVVLPIIGWVHGVYILLFG